MADHAQPCSHCKDYDFPLSHVAILRRVFLGLPFPSNKQLPRVAVLSLTGQSGAFAVNLSFIALTTKAKVSFISDVLPLDLEPRPLSWVPFFRDPTLLWPSPSGTSLPGVRSPRGQGTCSPRSASLCLDHTPMPRNFLPKQKPLMPRACGALFSWSTFLKPGHDPTVCKPPGQGWPRAAACRGTELGLSGWGRGTMRSDWRPPEVWVEPEEVGWGHSYSSPRPSSVQWTRCQRLSSDQPEYSNCPAKS